VPAVDAGFTESHRGGSGSPLVCLHGLTDTWRSWELVLPALEREHDVLAVTLAGHAGGPPLPDVTETALVDRVGQAMDEAGFETAHLVGNSLGGYVALQLAAGGRARSVVALAPGGGVSNSAPGARETRDFFSSMHDLVMAAAPHADAIAATPEGRRQATQYVTVNYEHIPPGLAAHLLRGAAGCEALPALLHYADQHDWNLEAERITCPVRIIWGTEDRILPWPAAAADLQAKLPQADWVVLDGIGHCPQLDVPLEAAELILGFTRD
jgi:pimeloyl-ACP methyl ester carboxylesterase